MSEHPRFRPAPEHNRCAAVILRVGWTFQGGRCLQPKLHGGELCEKHQLMADRGERVARVSPPREVA